MSVAVALQFEDSQLEERSHPVPFGHMQADDSALLLKRSTLLSLGLHGLLVVVALALNYWPKSELIGTPQDVRFLDATIVPLSALDTVLPKGAPDVEQQQQPTPPLKEPEPAEARPEPPKREPEKRIVEARSLTTFKSKADSSRKSSDDAKPSNESAVANSQRLGVANGSDITLENARISYQDMVATRLARAKRYPERALKRGMTGEGSIKIEIASDGNVRGVEILRSTEAPILDEELRAMVDRAAPFPAFPSDLRKTSLALVVPVAFKLQD
jgi:protein TonB